MTSKSKNGCEITFVLPNVMSLNPKHSRGSLHKRCEMALQYDFSYIEVPAHFIRNKEPEFTGLNPGGFLTKGAIKQLYSEDGELPSGVKYILHTDPQLSPKCHLRWDDKVWRKRFINMQIDLASHLGFPPSMIEIHPGKGP